MPAYLLYGDNFLVSQSLKELQEQVGTQDVIDANSHRVLGGAVNLAQIRALCDAVPFLAEHRLVMVEGLFPLFEPRDGRRRQSSSAGRSGSSGTARSAPSGWEGLPEYIQGEMPPSTLLVFLEATVSKANSLLRSLRSVVEIQDRATPTGEGLARWIRNMVAEKGARITPGAIRLLISLTGNSLWMLDNDLEKLALYAGDRAIEEIDVRLLVSQSREASIFSAVDALLDGRASVAMGLIHRLREDGAELPYIVSMTARQLRLVTLAKELIDGRQGEKVIRDRLGINHDFALKRTMEQARKHSWDSLEWLYKKLLDADLAVKQGRMNQDLALELMVAQASDLSLESRRSSPASR